MRNTAYQLERFPLFDDPFLKGSSQYFSGFGERLIGNNHCVNYIGLELQLTDMLCMATHRRVVPARFKANRIRLYRQELPKK